MKLNKTYELASFKALESEGPGKFEAVVSVFGNVDLQGDRVMPGAFKSTIKSLRQKSQKINVVWSHDWLNPDAFIGWADPNDVMEISIGKSSTGISGGLLVKGQIDVHKPFAAQVFDLMKEGRIREWSFAYDVNREKTAEDGANELLDVELLEVGPCLKGANPDTYTISAKSALERELEEAYDAQKSLTKFIDLIKTVDDPEIARMLTKTMMGGPSEKKTERFHVQPRISAYDGKYSLEQGDEFVCIRNATGEIVDAHETEPEAQAHVKTLEGTHLPSMTIDEIRASLGLEPLEEKSEDLYEEKTGSKPWHIEKQGNQYCVIKDADGTVAGCHDTQQQAEAQVRALYAQDNADAAPPATMSDGDSEQKDAEADGNKWDGSAAMASCHSAGDFRKIAFERANDSDPETAAHWALPHHSSPGAEADPTGVSAALAALNGARGGAPDLKNEGAARSHLEAHGGGSSDEGKSVDELHEEALMVDHNNYSSVSAGSGNFDLTYSTSTAQPNGTTTWTITLPDGEKVGQMVGAKAADNLKIRLTEAVDAFVREVNGQVEAEAPEEESKNDEPDGEKAETPTEFLDRLLGEEK